MYEVVKRDGQVVDFNIGKIADAIKKAFEATKTEYNGDIIDFLALKVSADFLPKIKDGKIAVEDIQDSVEAVLSRGGYENVAKAYILYRKQREKLRNMKSTYLDYKDTVNKPSRPTTGSARSTTRRSRTRTATATSTCTTCRC